MMKLMIIGYTRHGKDTVCEILRDKFEYTFASSSYTAAKHVLYPHLANKYGYKTFEECYADRHNHRAEWYERIKSINTPDRTKLGRIIYSENDIYCGIRNRSEFEALRDKGVFQVSIWVDASKRLPPESTSSMDLMKEDAMYVIDNNGTLEELEANVENLMELLDSEYA